MSEDWNRLSSDYAAVQDSRRTTLFPAIIERLKSAPPRSLLDYGGGDGLFAIDCAALPITRIATYDPAPNIVALARENCPTDSRIQIAESSKEFPDGGFEIVTFNGVWMHLATERECQAVLEDIHRLLTPGGGLITAVTHPCFRNQKFSTYRTDFELKNYLTDGTRFGVTMFDGAKQVHFTDTHWSLGAMSRQLRETGFVITEIVELSDQITDKNDNAGSPWLIIFARKV